LGHRGLKRKSARQGPSRRISFFSSLTSPLALTANRPNFEHASRELRWPVPELAHARADTGQVVRGLAMCGFRPDRRFRKVPAVADALSAVASVLSVLSLR
jgi:hypothetical protein